MYISDAARSVADQLEQIDRDFEDEEVNPDLIRVNINEKEESEFPHTSEEEGEVASDSEDENDGAQINSDEDDAATASIADTVMTDSVVTLNTKQQTGPDPMFGELRADPEFQNYMESCVQCFVENRMVSVLTKETKKKVKSGAGVQSVKTPERQRAQPRAGNIGNTVKSPSDMTLYAPALAQLPVS